MKAGATASARRGGGPRRRKSQRAIEDRWCSASALL